MNILAIDQSTKTVGIAVFKEGILTKSDAYEIQNEDIYLKIYEVTTYVKSMIKMYDIDYVFLEEIFMGLNVNTYKKLAFVLGSLINFFIGSNVKFGVFYPTTWKAYHKILKDKRIEQKISSKQKVMEIFNIDAITDDESDAILIGLYGIYYLENEKEILKRKEEEIIKKTESKKRKREKKKLKDSA